MTHDTYKTTPEQLFNTIFSWEVYENYCAL